jgi:hypothetical protein
MIEDRVGGLNSGVSGFEDKRDDNKNGEGDNDEQINKKQK